MTTLINSRDDLIKFAARLDGVKAVGFDTEFHAETSYRPKVMLLQFSSPEEIVLVDPLVSEVRDAIGGFLELIKMREQVVIGHALEHDLEIFLRLNGGLPARAFDTQIAAAFVGMGGPIGLGQLLKDVLGVEVDKVYSRADWGKRPLPPAQMEYAADDVRHLHALMERLQADIDRLDRTAWLEEECATLLDPERYAGRPPEEAWRRIRRRLPSARARAVLVHVAAERERVAKDTDTAPRRVLHDDVVLDLAARAPTKKDDLKGETRRSPGSHLMRHADAWLAAIKLGLEEPLESDDASPALSPDARAAARLLELVMQATLESGQVAPWLFGSRSDELEDTVRIPPETRAELEARLNLSGWRRELLGAPLWRVIQGARVGVVRNADGQLVYAPSDGTSSPA